MKANFFRDWTRLYECDKKACEHCNEYDEGCHLTTDINHAVNPEKYKTMAELKADNKKEETTYA